VEPDKGLQGRAQQSCCQKCVNWFTHSLNQGHIWELAKCCWLYH